MFLVLFFVFLASLFLVYALFLFTSRKSDAKRRLLNERLAEAIRSSAHSSDVEVQLARDLRALQPPAIAFDQLADTLLIALNRRDLLGVGTPKDRL